MSPHLLLQDNSLAIFLFHGVVRQTAYEVRNYNRKHIDEAYFLKIMKELKSEGNALSMNDIMDYYDSGEPLPPRSFAVTFDDGFENNYSVAAPILKDLGVPATFYVTTGFVQNNAMSWIDRIEYCIEQRPSGSILLPWRSQPIVFSGREARIEMLEEIRFHVKRSPDIAVDDLVASIFEQCAFPEVFSSEDPLDLKMSWGQVREMDNEPDFTIGGHSHEHCNMAFLNSDELISEVDTSLNLLKNEAGIETVHYSYPEGLDFCYSDSVIAVLKSRGIKCCPTAEEGFNIIGDDLFRLKRLAVV